jgi:hypothetical protein
MNSATLRNSIRAMLIGAAATTASIGWAQQQQPEPPTPATPTEPAPSQTPEPTDPTSPSTTPHTEGTTAAIDDKKIDQFADAYVAVQKIQANAASELDSTANDPAKQQQTQARVENEMIAAVERTGLKLEEFNGIVQTMSADANLRARVVAKIKERMGG